MPRLLVPLEWRVEHRRRRIRSGGNRRGVRRFFDGDHGHGTASSGHLRFGGESPAAALGGVALAQLRALPLGAGRQAGADQHDLPLHIETPVVVAGRARFPDAVAGIHQRCRQHARRQLGARRVDTAEERPDSGRLPASRLNAHLARCAADLPDRHRMEVGCRRVRRCLRRVHGPDAGERQLRGHVLGRGLEARRGEPPPLERRRREQRDVRGQRLGPQAADGGHGRGVERHHRARRDEVGRDRPRWRLGLRAGTGRAEQDNQDDEQLARHEWHPVSGPVQAARAGRRLQVVKPPPVTPSGTAGRAARGAGSSGRRGSAPAAGTTAPIAPTGSSRRRARPWSPRWWAGSG